MSRSISSARRPRRARRQAAVAGKPPGRAQPAGRAHGIGRLDLVENCFVGTKSRGMYETPGGTILIAAHRGIELITLDRGAAHLKDELMPKYAELIYNGFGFAPEREMLQAAIDKSQEFVSGTVKLKLYKGNVAVVGRSIALVALRPGPRHLRGGQGHLRSSRCRRLHPLECVAPAHARAATEEIEAGEVVTLATRPCSVPQPKPLVFSYRLRTASWCPSPGHLLGRRVVTRRNAMADKSSFAAQEWTLLLESVMAAGMAVSMADTGGLWALLQEGFASGGALVKAKVDAGTNALIKAVVADLETGPGRSAAREGLQRNSPAPRLRTSRPSASRSCVRLRCCSMQRRPPMRLPSRHGSARSARPWPKLPRRAGFWASAVCR